MGSVTGRVGACRWRVGAQTSRVGYQLPLNFTPTMAANRLHFVHEIRGCTKYCVLFVCLFIIY